MLKFIRVDMGPGLRGTKNVPNCSRPGRRRSDSTFVANESQTDLAISLGKKQTS